MAPKKGRGTGTGTTARLVLGISGASGAAIGVRVAHALSEARVPFDLVISHGARAVLQEECGIERGALEGLAECAYEDSDLAAPIASGSHPTRGMAIVPCSSHTVAKIALGLADTLLTRAAHVHLKERRPLVLVPRETPLDAILLRHMSRLAELGVVLLIAAPPYYHRPKSVNDQTDFLAGKVLDHLGVPHRLYAAWGSGGR